MASSEEETSEPTGFTLKIPKFNRSMKRKRSGAKNKNTRTLSLPSPTKSLSDGSLQADIDVFDFEFDSPSSAASKKRSSDKPSRKRKKRPRNQILASISANAKRMPIPIPSFQMMKKRKESDLRSKKLSQLERAFFDEDEEDEENENDSASNSNGDKGDQVVKANNKGIIGISSDRSNQSIAIANVSHLSKEKRSGGFPREDSTNPPKSRDYAMDIALSQDGDFEGESGNLHFSSLGTKKPEEYDQLPRSQSPDTIAEHEANPVVMHRQKRMQTNDPAKDSIQTSLPSGDTFGGEAIDLTDNDTGAIDDNEDGDDSNFVDFGDDDGDCAVDDYLTAGNCEELHNANDCDKDIIQTNSIPPTEAPSIEPPGSCHNESTMPLSLDLDHEVDLLFQKSDTNTITMNLFCKELECRIGVPLKKKMKKNVKARVMSLLNGEIVPSYTTGKTVGTCGVQDRTEDDGDTNCEEMDSTSKENTASESEISDPKECTNSKKDNGEGNETNRSESSILAIEAPSILETSCEVEAIGEKPISSTSNPEETENEKAIPSKDSTFQKKQDWIDEEKNGDNNTSKNYIANLTSNLYCVEIETKKPTNPEPDNQTKSKKDTTSKAKRQRKTKPKSLDKGKKSTGETTDAPEKKRNQTRKRSRKAATCALCKTCPCQRTHTTDDCENIATLDIKNFSRSDGAVERTLLRRLQKLEKSTERLEEQTEIVRRRLKKHRRDRDKRLDRQKGTTSNDDKTTESYFLPDAEVFEKQQHESEGMPSSAVGKAQSRVFQNVATYQPTLFEMMGIARDGDKTKENADSEMKDSTCNNGEEKVSHNAEDTGDENDEDIPAEYVPERTFEEKVHRFEWKNGARDTADQETGIASGSIFDTVLPLTQDPDDEVDAKRTKKTTSVPLWDDLFESSTKGREKASADDAKAGLNDLLCLFEDGSVDSNREDDLGSSLQTSEDRIDPKVLSQGAQTVANEVISSVPSREMLEGSCPNWKENIYFALMQKDPNDLEQALENVQQSRMRLQAQKEELLKAWECKNAALEVFETALKASFDRSKPK